MTNKEAELAEQFALHTSQSFFLTGKAGTGKTTLLKKLIKQSKKNVAVIAPTGVAAINAGGSTIHSFFGFPLKIFVPSFDRVDLNVATNKALLKNHLRYKVEKRKIIQQLELLIIDEISMVRADTLDAIDYALKYTRKNQEPFGGVQLIVIGDLFQLSPIAREHEWSILRNYYRSPYFYNSIIWREASTMIIELKIVYRQEEEEFIHMLNTIRNGNTSSEVLAHLNERYDPDFSTSKQDSIILTTHNYKANDINLKALNNLSGRAYKFKAEVSGTFSDSAFPAEEYLTLKEGAQIMFLRNDTDEGAYFNGKLAIIEKIRGDDIKVKFHDDGKSYYLKKETWENKTYTLDNETNEISQEVSGSFIQYPVRLAWAITIHKSQGLTFQNAVIDVEDAFAMGQTYVALSRCTNMSGMVLKSMVNERSIKVNQEVKTFYESATDIKILQQGLQNAKNFYSKKKLRSTFSFEYLIDDLVDWKKMVEEKTIPGKAKVMDLFMKMDQCTKNISQISKSFQFQLDKVFQRYAESKDDTEIIDRTTKAIGFFSNEMIEKIIKPLHLHIGEYAMKKAVKLYLRKTEELQASFWGKLSDLYDASFLSESIWKEKQFKKDDLPKISGLSDKVKSAKGDTFKITLNLFKEGKNASEIAEIRSMAVTTIEGHLARWIKEGGIDIKDVVDPKVLKKIMPIVKSFEGDKLAELKNLVPSDISWGMLRCIVAYADGLKEKEVK